MTGRRSNQLNYVPSQRLVWMATLPRWDQSAVLRRQRRKQIAEVFIYEDHDSVEGHRNLIHETRDTHTSQNLPNYLPAEPSNMERSIGLH